MGNNGMFPQTRSAIAASFRGFDNALTQHRSLLYTTVSDMLRYRLRESAFPFAMGGCSWASPSRDPPPRVIVFVVGGTTYEEARDVAEINKTLTKTNGRCVILGGSTVHNSQSFLADVAL